MKKITTLLALLPLAATAFGQAITITATDVPVPGTVNFQNLSNLVMANPVIATNFTWNYSGLVGTNPYSITYTPETDAYFTAAGVDVSQLVFRTLSRSTGMGYFTYSELDFNTANVKEAGINIREQKYELSAFTGSTADSLNIPDQKQLLPVPRVVLQFPFTMGSAWSSVSRRIMDFNLTIAMASLDHTPAQLVSYVHRRDTIIGWGKLTLHTPSGPSAPVDVLMDRISQYCEDSFYLAGSPAPTALLSNFGLAQNQKLDSNYRYNFYRRGAYDYLYSYSYVSDATYSTPLGQYASTDNLVPAGVHDVAGATFTTILFPNPTNGSAINLLISGREVAAGRYCIIDAAGRMVQSSAFTAQQGAMRIGLDATLANGNYTITVMDINNTKLFSEQFTIAK